MSTMASHETDLFRTYWDDGLLDVFFGVGVLVLGIGWRTPLGPLTAMLLPLALVLWNPLRRRIVEPRSGYVRFSRSRRQHTGRMLHFAWALGVGALVVTLAAAVRLQGLEARAVLERLVVGFPAVLLALGACVVAALTGARRFVSYGLVLVASAAGAVALQSEPDLPLIVAGAAVTAWGVRLLARFVRDSRSYEAS